MRKPAKNDGKLAGIHSSRIVSTRLAPRKTNRSRHDCGIERTPNSTLLASGKNATTTVTKTRAANDGPKMRTMIGVSTMTGVTCMAMSHGHTARSTDRADAMKSPSALPSTTAMTRPVSAVATEIPVAVAMRSTVRLLRPSNSLCGGGTMSADPSLDAKLLSSEYARPYQSPTNTLTLASGARQRFMREALIGERLMRPPISGLWQRCHRGRRTPRRISGRRLVVGQTTPSRSP